jgi:hypothetical protein
MGREEGRDNTISTGERCPCVCREGYSGRQVGSDLVCGRVSVLYACVCVFVLVCNCMLYACVICVCYQVYL